MRPVKKLNVMFNSLINQSYKYCSIFIWQPVKVHVCIFTFTLVFIIRSRRGLVSHSIETVRGLIILAAYRAKEMANFKRGDQ